jgi:hypothetical protein
MSKKWLSAALLATLTLTGCFINEDNLCQPKKAAFTATIEQQNASRAYDTSWEAGDVIGISGTSGETIYSNIAYTTTDGDGTFSPVNTEETINYMNDESVEFTAYYPWQKGAASVIEFSTTNQSDKKSFDYLYGTGSGSYTSPQVSIDFKHAMSKLTLKIKLGTGFSSETLPADATVRLSGLVHEGSFSLTECNASKVQLKSTATTVSDWDVTTSYGEMILLPQDLSNSPLTIAITIDGQTYTNSTSINPNMQQGKSYSYGITVYRSGLAITGSSISAWEQINGNDGEAIM